MKYIKFKTKLFDSNEILAVKIPYNLIAKLFGFKDINLITLEEDKFNYYSDNSFDRIQQIIQRKYGNPAYCDGTDQHLIKLEMIFLKYRRYYIMKKYISMFLFILFSMILFGCNCFIVNKVDIKTMNPAYV